VKKLGNPQGIPKQRQPGDPCHESFGGPDAPETTHCNPRRATFQKCWFEN